MDDGAGKGVPAGDYKGEIVLSSFKRRLSRTTIILRRSRGAFEIRTATNLRLSKVDLYGSKQCRRKDGLHEKVALVKTEA